MIYVDSTEFSSTSKLPRIKGAQASDCLEVVSGADIMVTTLKMPASSETLIRKHAEGGAIFIQRKSGRDFVSSILDERINIALARMLDIGTTCQYQRCIMSTGFFVPNGDGAVRVGTLHENEIGDPYIELCTIDPPIQYVSVATVRRRIAMRGGWYLPLTCDKEIPGELHHMQKDLDYIREHPVKELVVLPKFPPAPPDPTDPFQRPIEVKDGRIVIAAFQGIGIGKAGTLWDAVKGWNRINRPPELGFTEADWTPTVLQLLTWAARSKDNLYELPKILMWGDRTHANVREQLGLYPHQELCVTLAALPEEEETEDEDRDREP